MIINGERISGGVDGPEAMLGTLVRVILEKVRQMRDRYIEQFPGDPIQKKSAIFSDLDESQALSCARDVLLASNRTESGGDTYFAIESMLINKRFAVLTPLASEEEPLEIIVDIVESKRNSFHHRSRDELHVQPAPRTDTSKRADDFTDSSGLSYSVSTTDDNMFDRVTLSQFQDQFGDSNDLSMPSDIDGATAIKSTISTSKFVKRRTKDSIKFHSHPSGSASDSSNFSESNHLEESFIPDTSHEETSESADDPFLIRSTSFDSSDSPFLEKSSMNFPTDEKVTGDAECSGRCRDTFSEGFPPTLIPSQYPNPDDVTIDLSEVTLDSALVFREKQISGPSFPSVIRLVSPNPSKSRSEKGLLSHLLNRNEGHDQHHESDKPTYSKKQNALSGIRKALKSRILSTKEIEDPIVDSVSSAAQSMCIRIQMIAKSKYRLCNLDPQNELEDNWAIIHGSFHQVFFLKSHSNGRPSMSDRLVTVKVVSAR